MVLWNSNLKKCILLFIPALISAATVVKCVLPSILHNFAFWQLFNFQQNFFGFLCTFGLIWNQIEIKINLASFEHHYKTKVIVKKSCELLPNKTGEVLSYCQSVQCRFTCHLRFIDWTEIKLKMEGFLRNTAKEKHNLTLC